MSNAFRCDRCKKFYDRKDEDNLKRISYQGTRIYGMCLTDINQSRITYFDLCRDCVKALDNFMNHNHPEMEDKDIVSESEDKK